MPLGRICSRQNGAICVDCPKSCRLDNQRRAAKSKAHGLTTTRWARLRLQRLTLDRWQCQLRLGGCTGRAATVHLRAALGGNHQAATIDDCVSACGHCHGVLDGPRARR
jgi:hypothetical protein